MEIKLNLTDQEAERFIRTFQDSRCQTYGEFVMKATDFVDRLRFSKEKVGAKGNAVLLVRNPKNHQEYILEKY